MDVEGMKAARDGLAALVKETQMHAPPPDAPKKPEHPFDSPSVLERRMQEVAEHKQSVEDAEEKEVASREATRYKELQRSVQKQRNAEALAETCGRIPELTMFPRQHLDKVLNQIK